MKYDVYDDELLDRNFNRIVGETIKKYREKKHLSYQELSDKIDNIVSRQTLYNYEANITNIRHNVFILICKALGQNPGDVFKEISDEYAKYVEENKDNYVL